MATIDTRAYSQKYSGLATETYLALAIGGIGLTSFELMRHRRRKTQGFKATFDVDLKNTDLASVETWEFGYLFQARCWAKRPSPPLPKLPLAWVKQMIQFPEAAFLPLVGPDTTVYARFLRGNWYFTLLHLFTTFPILLPIHLHFALPNVPKSSMTRASLTSLVASATGKRLLPVHLCLLLWITLTWMANLLWIIRGGFMYRRQAINLAAEQANAQDVADDGRQQQFGRPNVEDTVVPNRLKGWRLKSIMVANIPAPLRDEKLLKEYFEFYLARIKAEPPPAPGLVEGLVSFISRFMQAERQARSAKNANKVAEAGINEAHAAGNVEKDHEDVGIEKVVIVRKMTELASLLQRREEVLKALEEAHIQLAQAALKTVAEWLEKKERGGKAPVNFLHKVARKKAHVRDTMLHSAKDTQHPHAADVEMGTSDLGDEQEEERMNELSQALYPFLQDFGMLSPGIRLTSPRSWIHRTTLGSPSLDKFGSPGRPENSPNTNATSSTQPTVWEVLYSLPRSHLDAFQPLIRLKSLFRGAHVPAIDYYTTKLGFLTALIHESRSQPTEAFVPSSTAFVTFSDPENARKCVKLLPSHPKNPLGCLVQPAPEFNDLDWGRLMKKTFTGEFLRNWVVDILVWGFTLIWIIPVSLFVSLVSINTLGDIWPALKNYLALHPTKAELISDLLPTVLVSGLTILIPLILLLIAKKAHNIVLLSKLHDQIMTRYYKFLVCNVLIFFCVGVAALQSFLTSFKQTVDVLDTVAARFPDAAPFYVGWLIFTTGMHCGLELGLLGLPLIVYRSTVLHATTPRKRKTGTRPRTFNFYYWLPNHLIVLIINFCFSILNPLTIPFSFLYFSVVFVVFRHQFLHVYSKAYEMNATVLMIRMQRYSLDGIMLAQFIFFALMIIEKETVLAVFTALFFGFTAVVKLYLTRFIKSTYLQDAIYEANLICGSREDSISRTPTAEGPPSADQSPLVNNSEHKERTSGAMNKLQTIMNRDQDERRLYGYPEDSKNPIRYWTWKNPATGVQFAYSTLPARRNRDSRGPNPFGPQGGPGAAASNGSHDEHVEHMPAAADFSHSAPPLKEEETSGGAHTTQRSPLDDLHQKRKHRLIEPHERRQPWDDAPRLDLTYENPAYTKPVENALWLPINPCAILDLDETIFMYRAITSEPEAGALGQWVNETSSLMVEPPGPETQRVGAGDYITEEEAADDWDGTDQYLTGTEKISLRPALESRVSSLGKGRRGSNGEGEERASLFGGKRPMVRRGSSTQSMASNQPTPQGRSFSMGTTASSARKPSNATLRPGRSQIGLGIMGTNGNRTRIRSGSIATSHHSQSPVDPLHHVDLGSQMPFADPNMNIILRNKTSLAPDSPHDELSPPPPSAALDQSSLGIGRPRARTGSITHGRPNSQLVVASGGSRLSGFGRPRGNSMSRASVTTREAVVGEVLAEEQLATAERVRQEYDEGVEERKPRKWWSSWLYQSSKPEQ